MMTPIDWLLSDDTGTSSETICMVMTGSRGNHYLGSPPSDNDDFGRCYRLLRLFPQWRSRLPEVAQRFPAWGPMVGAWGELETLWEAYCDPAGRVGAKEYAANKSAAKKLYERMKVLYDEGRIADGWKQTGPGSWAKGEAWSMTITPEDAKRMSAALKRKPKATFTP
jgi:hypothetical protein